MSMTQRERLEVQREHFEKWFTENICDDKEDLKRDMWYGYENEIVDYMWEAWKAALKSVKLTICIED